MQAELIPAEPQAADLSHVDRDLHEPERRAPDAYALIERAVEKGLDPAQLKALVDLHEQMRASRAAEEFAAEMNACQAELPLIVKDAENTQTKSRYAKMDYIQVIAKPVLNKHGFALSFAEDNCGTEGWKRTICDVRHSAGHCVRYHLDLPLDGVGAKGNAIGSMNRVQAAVSTGTYAQRYLICRIFNLTISDTDLDGRPPANDNPELRPDAPIVTNRHARRQPPAEHPNVAEVKHIMAEWKEKFGSDDKQQDKTRFWQWFTKATQSNTSPTTPADWSDAELAACRKALGIPNDSDLEGGN
jgi:hypothetical protein